MPVETWEWVIAGVMVFVFGVLPITAGISDICFGDETKLFKIVWTNYIKGDVLGIDERSE